MNNSSLQRIINLNNSSYNKLTSYINSCVHAKIVYVLSFLFLINVIDVSIWKICLDITRGYCFYDTLMVLFNDPYDYQTLIHHIFLFIGTYSYYITLYPHQTAIALLSEITNQFLYIGWLLIKKDLKDTIYFKINGMILLISFFLFRIINFTYLLYFLITYCDIYNSIIFIPITLLNYYWFYLLIQKIL